MVRVSTIYPNFEVFSHHPDGTLFKRVQSNTHSVMIEVPGCGAITAAPSFAAYFTVFGVEAGDDIYVNRYPGPDIPTTGKLAIAVDAPLANVNYYMADGGALPCTGYALPGAAPSIDLNYSSRCVRPDGKSDVLVYATSTGGSRPEYAFFTDVTLAQQPNLRVANWLTGASHHLSLSLSPQHPASSVVWGLGSMSKTYPYQRSFKSVGNAGSSFALDQQFAEFGDAASHYIALDYSTGQTRSIDQIIAAPVPSTITEDLEAKLLPLVNAPMLDTDPIRPSVSFTVDPPAIEEDLVRLVVTVSHPMQPQGSWFVLAPPGTRSVRLPEVPAPFQVSFPALPIFGQLADASDVPDYRAARQFSARMNIRTTFRVPLPVGTVARTSEYNF